MTASKFIGIIKRVVYDSSVRGCFSLLQKPPGRKPSPKLEELSQYVNHLSDHEKEMIYSIIELASKQTIFGLLAVFDGVRQVEDSETKGTFELIFNKAGNSVLINDPNEEYLHDLFNQQVPPL